MGLFSKTPPIDKFKYVVSEVERILPFVVKLQNSNLCVLENKKNLKYWSRELLSLRSQFNKLANKYPDIAILDPIFMFQGKDYRLSMIIGLCDGTIKQSRSLLRVLREEL